MRATASARPSATERGSSLTPAVRYARLSLAVARRDLVAATALLEIATDQLAAITGPSRERVVSAWLPVALSRGVARKVERMIRAAQHKDALGPVQFTMASVPDTAWATSWKRFYKPARIAPGVWIAPSWERRFQQPNGAVLLRIDPGMAFGTGLHPTTQLALKLLLPRVKREAVMIDIGCGSGILGLAAALRGARVYASDSDAIAVDAARANFAANALDACGLARAKDVPARFPAAHLVAANITGATLTRLAPALAGKLIRGGWLISSGVVPSGKDSVLRAFARAGLRLEQAARRGEWLAFAHCKSAR